MTGDAAAVRSGAGLGSRVREFVEWFGHVGFFCGRVVRACLTSGPDLDELARQLDEVGARSVWLVAVAGAAIGVVLTLETHASLARVGAESSLPAIIIVSIVRDTGPIITALIVSGRAGAGIAAELGAMKVTDQIDAMDVSGVNPYRYLAATRILACILMLPLLTLACDFSGIAMGWVVNTLTHPIALRLFLERGFKRATFNDFVPPTFKTMVFGAIIGVIACFQGMRVTGGTAGVGRAVTTTVVLSSLFIILADVVLVRLILVFFP
jgi:phospholipid/cholesterol/gamma-HCH transport system permease protein